ncbi:MAG: Hsp33 family molecular chaperone HslO [Alphaproteobacteria bacterium]
MTNNQDKHDNIIAPFTLNNHSFKGKIVKLSDALNNAVYKHSYPYHISKLLCELLIAASMIGDNLKHGILTIQIKSNDIINLLVADYFDGGKIRGYANWNIDAYEKIKDGSPSFQDLISNGYMAITLDQGPGTDLYQGIVEIKGNDLSECLNEYFIQSEQIETCFKIMVGEEIKSDGFKKWCGGGIMVQKLPDVENTNFTDLDAWEKVKIFVDTVKSDELIDPLIEPNTLLHRLFHEEEVWIYEPKFVEHKCRCSRERANNIVSTIPESELNELAIDGKVEVKCEFCGKEEIFKVEEIVKDAL